MGPVLFLCSANIDPALCFDSALHSKDSQGEVLLEAARDRLYAVTFLLPFLPLQKEDDIGWKTAYS